MTALDPELQSPDLTRFWPGLDITGASGVLEQGGGGRRDTRGPDVLTAGQAASAAAGKLSGPTSISAMCEKGKLIVCYQMP